MSERRTLLSRPRTRVYDCNYNIGEGYYKPMMDHLDRKYYGSSATKPTGNVFDGSSAKSHFGTGASAFDDYGTSTSPSPTTHSRRSHSGSDSRLSLADDDFEQEVLFLYTPPVLGESSHAYTQRRARRFCMGQREGDRNHINLYLYFAHQCRRFYALV